MTGSDGFRMRFCPARIMGVVVYGFDFERIFRPVIRCFGICMFTRWDDAVEPYDTTAHRESLPVAPHVLLSSFQNSAADSVIEDVIEVSQQLCSIADADPLVMKTRKHRIADQRCHCLTIIFLKGRLETAEESECAGTIRTS